jgi:DNA repair ATPase RecN
VRLLREAPARRQVVVVTHNPNIVVNADADLVISLRFIGGRITLRER